MVPGNDVKQEDSGLESLRATWKELYAVTLPSLARSKDSSQPKWPVTLDHCFARIILDNIVGSGVQQWDTVLPRPAIKNMSTEQLTAAIELGEKIKAGSVDLVELDKISLKCRSKLEGKYKDTDTGFKEENDPVEPNTISERKRSNSTSNSGISPKKRKITNGKQQSTLDFSSTNTSKSATQSPSQTHSAALPTSPDLTPSQTLTILHQISTHKSLTPFRKRLYTSLLSVPRGSYTTYAALATHLGSSARAVGNGMRNNPFAPQVPCHRVLASDGSLGGYGGDWGRQEKGKKGYLPKQEEKVKILEGEGVRFDSAGRVKGRVWSGFWDGKDWERELERNI